MVSAGNRTNLYPGLEVVHTTYDASNKILYERPQCSNLETVPSVTSTMVGGETDFSLQNVSATRKSKWSRRRVLLISAVAVVIVIAAVVGATCGVLLTKKKSNQSQPATIDPEPTGGSNTTSMFGNAKIASNYGSVTAATWGYPHMDLLITDAATNVLWLGRSTSASSITDWTLADTSVARTSGPFTYLGGLTSNITNSISAIARGGNNTDVFSVFSRDKGLWGKYRNESIAWGPTLSDWFYVEFQQNISRKSLYSPAGVGSWIQNRIDIFAVGQGGELWQIYVLDGRWTNWLAFGGNFKFDFPPTVVSWAEGRYDLFLVRANGSLGYKYFDGSSVTWFPPQESNSFYDLGGQLTSRPNAVTPEVGRLHVLARGGDAGLWHLLFDGVWNNWERIGEDSDTIQGDPAVVVLGNTIHVFAWAEDNSLITGSWAWETGSAANMTFTKLADGLIGAPTVVTDNVNIEVFARLENNRIGWKVFSHGQWTPQGMDMAGLWQYK